jgi:hypothetical protein
MRLHAELAEFNPAVEELRAPSLDVAVDP